MKLNVFCHVNAKSHEDKLTLKISLSIKP